MRLNVAITVTLQSMKLGHRTISTYIAWHAHSHCATDIVSFITSWAMQCTGGGKRYNISSTMPKLQRTYVYITKCIACMQNINPSVSIAQYLVKTIHDSFSCNSSKHCPILITFFSKTVTCKEKKSKDDLFSNLIIIALASAVPDNVDNTENAYFYLNAVMSLCQHTQKHWNY